MARPPRRKRAATITHVWPAEPADLPDLVAIHAESFTRGWTRPEFDALLAPDNVTALVLRPEASGNAPPVGFIVIRQAADEAEVITIAVAAAFRARGYGEALVRGAILHLRAGGAERLLLEVDEANAAAVGLYRKLGFADVGRRKGYYTEAAAASGDPEAVPADALVMELALTQDTRDLSLREP